MMEGAALFRDIAKKRAAGRAAGIYSICSANPFVLRAAIEHSEHEGTPVLIEATSNQVNQYGGYTGMTPCDFSQFVFEIAGGCGFPEDMIILGGDHLGPFVWKEKDEREAMALAEELVAAYAKAGFTKIHLDTSMRLGSDDRNVPLGDGVIAERAARLCAAAEKACAGGAIAYVVGSEVPPPGGPQEKINMAAPTDPDAFIASYHAFERAFENAGLSEPFSRVAAFVVQPGVEFTGDEVFEYDTRAAAGLCAALGSMPGSLVFEGHSTDYQTPDSLRRLVRDGVAVLKVGPALTFALHRGLMALEHIERELAGIYGYEPSRFTGILEEAMKRNNKSWKNYYSGDEVNLKLQQRYSFYDRARYYLPEPEVNAAVERLICNLVRTGIPITLLSQYLPQQFDRVRAGLLTPEPRELLKDCVRHILRGYASAVCQ